MSLIGPIRAEVTCAPSRRDFWFSAYLAELGRLSAQEAVAEADEALRLCDERWKKRHVVSGLTYRDDYTIGHSLDLAPGTDADTSTNTCSAEI